MIFSRATIARFSLLLCLLLPVLWMDAAGAVKKRKPARPPHGAVHPKKGKANRPARPAQPARPKRSARPSRVRRTAPRPKPAIALVPLDAEKIPPVDLEMPRGALDPFFRDLSALETPVGDNGAVRVVRILHLGDSHVAADYWTGEIRRRLQERFGDGGAGIVMPGRPWKYFRHAQAKSLDGDGWHTSGLKDAPADGVLGLSGVAMAPRGNAPASVLAPGRRFNVLLASETDRAAVRLFLDGVPFDNVSVRTRWLNSGGSDIALVTVSNREPLPDAHGKLSVVAAPDSGIRLLGAEFFSGRSGIVVDTLGLNGARMTALDKWSPRMRQQLLQEAKPSLIIVSYGTNEIATPHFTFEAFRADCVRVLRALREDSGGTAVLVTGPIDRAIRKKRARISMADAERPVVRALREAAAETGCAFWDAQQAMGGEGAILSWMRAGLAQNDGVHLTQQGYELQGKMLFDRLMSAYAAR